MTESSAEFVKPQESDHAQKLEKPVRTSKTRSSSESSTKIDPAPAASSIEHEKTATKTVVGGKRIVRLHAELCQSTHFGKTCFNFLARAYLQRYASRINPGHVVAVCRSGRDASRLPRRARLQSTPSAARRRNSMLAFSDPSTFPATSANVALMEHKNLEKFGKYTRLYFEDRSYTNVEELQSAGEIGADSSGPRSHAR